MFAQLHHTAFSLQSSHKHQSVFKEYNQNIKSINQSESHCLTVMLFKKNKNVQTNQISKGCSTNLALHSYNVRLTKYKKMNKIDAAEKEMVCRGLVTSLLLCPDFFFMFKLVVLDHTAFSGATKSFIQL